MVQGLNQGFAFGNDNTLSMLLLFMLLFPGMMGNGMNFNSILPLLLIMCCLGGH